MKVRRKRLSGGTARGGDLSVSIGRGRRIASSHTIHWIDDDTVDADGGYYEGIMSSSGNTYRVVRRNGKWVVTRDTMHWIS